jgi:hypothetical protein
VRIYTIQMSNLPKGCGLADQWTWRHPNYKARFLDTTTRGKHPFFAPGWDIVMGHKKWVAAGRPGGLHSGMIDDERYTAIYRERMRESYRCFKEHWEGLLRDVEALKEDLVLICFCRPGDFCHRHQLAGMLKKVAEKIGISCELAGEWPESKAEPMIGLYLADESE